MAAEMKHLYAHKENHEGRECIYYAHELRTISLRNSWVERDNALPLFSRFASEGPASADGARQHTPGDEVNQEEDR